MASTESVIREVINEILREDELPEVGIEAETALLEIGLDSLGLAVLVTRLESRLGYDPFSMMTEAVYPRTFEEFVAVYDLYAPSA